jgi:glutaredoxin-related protein
MPSKGLRHARRLERLARAYAQQQMLQSIGDSKRFFEHRDSKRFFEHRP